MNLWDIYHSNIPDFMLEFLQTDSLQRLRNVGMNCGCEYTNFPIFRNIESYSRFDHSVGVGLIVWHFTGDVTQAVSGLLHDIATPAFAHVVDFLHNDHMRQECTESATEQVIRSSESLRRVLMQYDLPVESVWDYHCYPIADNDTPKLSADRLEYTLSNAVNFRIITKDDAMRLFSDLIVGLNEVEEPEIMFNSADTAYVFANAALACSKIYVSDADRYAMESLALLLRDALVSGIISEKCLDLDEPTVIDKILNSKLSHRWNRFCNYQEVNRVDGADSQAGALCVIAKKRCIDPYIQGLGRVSAVFPKFSTELKDFLDSSQDYWLIAK